MIFDVASFGMGLGLVMVGWVCGMIVCVVLSLVRRLGTLV
jgi:hypothetical protein